MNLNMSEEHMEQPNSSCHYFQEQMLVTIHNFYITGEIGPAHNYIEMIHAIRTAPQSDVIKIRINSTGGQLDTGIQIINAMQESQAHIICILEAQAYSMGSMIFLSGDEFVVHDNALLMIHNFSGGVFGKGHEQKSRLQAVSEWFEKFAADLYVPFISEDELESVINNGTDMWMQVDEIETRLIHMVENRQAKVEELMEEVLEKEKPTPPPIVEINEKDEAKKLSKRKTKKVKD